MHIIIYIECNEHYSIECNTCELHGLEIHTCVYISIHLSFLGHRVLLLLTTTGGHTPVVVMFTAAKNPGPQRNQSH